MAETTENKNPETRLAVIETNIAYIKQQMDQLSYKLDNIDFSRSFEKQGERVGKIEQNMAVLESKVKALLWGVAVIGSTAIAALTTAIIKLLGA